MVVHQLISSSSTQPSGSRQQNSSTGYIQNLNAQHYLSLLVTLEDILPNNWKPNQPKSLTSNILPTTITNDELLTAIFSFEFKETTSVSLFSRAILDTKLITAMYTDTKVNDYLIKLILDNGSAGSIITRKLMNQLVCVDCNKKLSLMSACYDDNKEYSTATKFYCHLCIIKWFGCPKRQKKWDNKLCLTCGTILSDKEIWNDIPE
ncbi:hypothetical protein G9A89_005869 [Geosiphon pyriformis]|nr:hypothetical protein G9A89_005869 [Geosiphon pyriformis]